MEVQLNNAALKGMVKVLRAEFPELKQARGYEIVSKMLGHPNWDTLSGLLKAGEQLESSQEARWAKLYGWGPEAPKTDEPVRMYVQAYADSPVFHSTLPEFGVVMLTQKLLNLVHKLQTNVLKQEGLDSVTHSADNFVWDARNGDEWHLSSPDLVVTRDMFYFVSYPKHASFNVETTGVPISDLRAALAPNGRGSSSLDWAAGMLFASTELGAKDFARGLLYDEVIDIMEVCIDKMAN